MDPFTVYRVDGRTHIQLAAWYADVSELLYVEDTDVGIPPDIFWAAHCSEKVWGIRSDRGLYRVDDNRRWATNTLGTFSVASNSYGWDSIQKAMKAREAYADELRRVKEDEAFIESLEILPKPTSLNYEASLIRHRLEEWDITREQVDVCLADSDFNEGSKACFHNMVGLTWHLCWEVAHGIRQEPTKANPIQLRKSDPISQGDMLELEHDFATACNMMLGQPYEQAVESGKQWMRDARE